MTLTGRQKTLITLICILALGAYAWAFHAVFTSKVPGANDFFSRWAGTRLYLTRGCNPYGVETSLAIQKAIWGHPAESDEDPSLFAYPFYTIFLVAPYALIPDYAWAQAAWQVTLQVVVVAGFFLMLAYCRWRPTPWLLGALFLWVFTYYPTARALILGQLALVILTLTVLALWLITGSGVGGKSQGGRDRWAGIVLAITTIKPQMQFLIIPFMLLWALRERRWQFILAFVAAMAALLIPSFILWPAWVNEWLAQVRLYPSYTPPAVLYIITREIVPLGAVGAVVEIALNVLLIGYMLFEWWRVLWLQEEYRFDWVIGLTLIITHLTALRTATTHFVVFLFPLMMLFRDLSQRRPWGNWAVLAIMAVLTVGMWWLFLATVEGAQEHNLVHVPLPVLMLVLMLLIRPRDKSVGQQQAFT